VGLRPGGCTRCKAGSHDLHSPLPGLGFLAWATTREALSIVRNAPLGAGLLAAWLKVECCWRLKRRGCGWIGTWPTNEQLDIAAVISVCMSCEDRIGERMTSAAASLSLPSHAALPYVPQTSGIGNRPVGCASRSTDPQSTVVSSSRCLLDQHNQSSLQGLGTCDMQAAAPTNGGTPGSASGTPPKPKAPTLFNVGSLQLPRCVCGDTSDRVANAAPAASFAGRPTGRRAAEPNAAVPNPLHPAAGVQQ
jgi:hypothetical protein